MSSKMNPSGLIESEHPNSNRNRSRLYNIYQRPFKRHYEVKSAADQFLYYGEVSSFRSGKPDIILHRGTSASGPVVGACKITKFSGKVKLALGNPDDSKNVQWEEMTRDSWMHESYRFEMNMPDPVGGAHKTRRALIWKHTRSVGVDGSSPSWTSRNYKLVDERTGVLVAVFSSKWSISRCGKLQIEEDHGEWFDTVILLAYISLHEKLRRNSAAAAGAGGGA